MFSSVFCYFFPVSWNIMLKITCSNVFILLSGLRIIVRCCWPHGNASELNKQSNCAAVKIVKWNWFFMWNQNRNLNLDWCKSETDSKPCSALTVYRHTPDSIMFIFIRLGRWQLQLDSSTYHNRWLTIIECALRIKMNVNKKHSAFVYFYQKRKYNNFIA